MFEYCITNGEGTLIDYGTVSRGQNFVLSFLASLKGETLMISECGPNCETGK